MNAIIKIYDYFASHRWLVFSICGILTALCVLMACRLEYHEDIFDFLPQDDEYTESMQVWSSLSEASRIVVIFEGNDPDSITQAIDAFAEMREDAITEVDIESFLNRLDYIYAHLPYFMTDEAYNLLEAACDTDCDTLHSLLEGDRQILSMPGTSFLRPAISSDPLHLVPVARAVSGQYAGAQSSFTSYDGYMMTSDQRMGFAFVDSPYGSTETGSNAALVDSLTDLTLMVQASSPSVTVRLLGAPVIAVGNARQIKKDSVWAVGLSVILIFALLFYAFPRKRDILLIFLSVGFGWLTGMAALYLCVGKVSVIVLGIGAILIGIGINYPLHLLVHQRYTTSVRQTLQEVISPLVTGNITTVAAFLALIPLHSPALRQLGIFAAAMFLGTIVFCIFVLPHLMTAKPAPVREIRLPFKYSPLRTTHYALRSSVAVVLFILLAVVLLVRHQPMFDSNLSHINYMTETQRQDFAWFESLSPVSDEPAYLATGARDELEQRLMRWNEFWQTHDAEQLALRLQNEATKAGFRSNAFEPFIGSLRRPPETLDLSSLETLAQLWPGRFDTEGMNARVTESLTDNFDYIGLVCSLIVLVFLCLSFRSIAHGLIAFLPMVFSWVLIFGLMQLFGLQFNIVNVILATFIFGQGDDYTIFVVEGLLYEQRHGRPMLDRYKQSIILSALVMLMAIGVLVFARHPAMHSLGAVTLIGMSCVVMMAFVVPPFLFRLLSRIQSHFQSRMKSRKHN